MDKLELIDPLGSDQRRNRLQKNWFNFLQNRKK